MRVRTTYEGPRGPLPNTILAIEGIVVEMWVGERVASIVAYSRSIHLPSLSLAQGEIARPVFRS